MTTTMEEIEDRITKINSLEQLKDELKLMWRIIYASYVQGEKEKEPKKVIR